MPRRERRAILISLHVIYISRLQETAEYFILLVKTKRLGAVKRAMFLCQRFGSDLGWCAVGCCWARQFSRCAKTNKIVFRAIYLRRGRGVRVRRGNLFKRQTKLIKQSSRRGLFCVARLKCHSEGIVLRMKFHSAARLKLFGIDLGDLACSRN